MKILVEYFIFHCELLFFVVVALLGIFLPFLAKFKNKLEWSSEGRGV